jgi:hypothetical protein
MFYKEFVTSFDWEHTGEGLAAFHHYALVAPRDGEYVKRVKRSPGSTWGKTRRRRTTTGSTG